MSASFEEKALGSNIRNWRVVLRKRPQMLTACEQLLAKLLEAPSTADTGAEGNAIADMFMVCESVCFAYRRAASDADPFRGLIAGVFTEAVYTYQARCADLRAKVAEALANGSDVASALGFGPLAPGGVGDRG